MYRNSNGSVGQMFDGRLRRIFSPETALSSGPITKASLRSATAFTSPCPRAAETSPNGTNPRARPGCAHFIFSATGNGQNLRDALAGASRRLLGTPWPLIVMEAVVVA